MDIETFNKIESYIASSGEDLIPYEILNEYNLEKEKRARFAILEEERIRKLRIYNERKGNITRISRTSFCLNNDDVILGTEFFFKTKNGYSKEIHSEEHSKKLENAYLNGDIGLDKVCNHGIDEIEAFNNCTRNFCGDSLFNAIKDEDRFVTIAINEKAGNGFVARYGAIDVLRGVGVPIGMYPSCKLLYKDFIGPLICGNKDDKYKILKEEFNSHRIGDIKFFICNLKVDFNGKVKIDSLSVNQTYKEHIISLKKKYGIPE